MNNDFYNILDYYIPNPKCELIYEKDYELLIATVLSAQCTDKRVNIVTKELFSKYNSISEIANANLDDVKNIIMPCGSYNKKALYIILICKDLLEHHNGKVPNDFDYLMTLPGVGVKTINVVLKNLYSVPSIPVDTHVLRVSQRLGLANIYDSPLIVESKLQRLIPIEKWNRVSEQLLLFGRYYCKSKSPACSNCLFKSFCKKK